MVKTKGPLLTGQASGTLAKTLNFALNHKTQSARLATKPKVTRTGKQHSIRTMTKFLGSAWAALTDSEKATWQQLADERNYSPYHAYLSENMKRWRNLRGPSKEYPATEAGPVPFTARPNPYPGWHHLGLKSLLGAPPEVWGFIFHLKHTSSPFATSHDTVRSILVHSYPPRQLWKEYDLEPGPWVYYSRSFSHTGLTSPLSSMGWVLIP